MAKECPESPAVVCNDKVLTYSELNQKANQLAHLLIDQGAKPETFIALALPRSAEMVVSMLAVLKAGAAYLPIDPDYPADRIEYMLNDAQPLLVMTSKEAIADIEREIGPIDMLVNVAGVLRTGLIHSLSDEDWEKTFNVNSTGVFNVSRAVARRMVPRRTGAIVTVGSNAAAVPRMHMAAYAASKAAALMFTKCLGLEMHLANWYFVPDKHPATNLPYCFRGIFIFCNITGLRKAVFL